MEKNSLYAAIDVGSNTLRMLIGRKYATGFNCEIYQQKITRLAGGYTEGKGLTRESIDRTLSAFTEYAALIKKMQVEKIRVVGTAALRRAENSQSFINQVKLKTRLPVEIISGKEEARLSSTGVLSILDPCPEVAVIIDIGGGSTEIVFCENKKILFSRSYPLGVVQLCEEMPDEDERVAFIKTMVVKFTTDMLYAGINADKLSQCHLVGTAGTITTLAAVNLRMTKYDRNRINNHHLDSSWLEKTLVRLKRLTVQEREFLPGIEKGRGDLIVPGLELIIALCCYFKKSSIQVADAGLLEGILIDFCQH